MPPKPPPKKITNLRQIDITKLDIKDLQHIDYEKLLKDVRKRPDTAISFAVPLIAMFICLSLFTKFQKEQKTLSNTIYQMNEKVQLVDEYHNAQTEFNQFTASLPPSITENDFINTVTDLAAKNKIQIESYSPSQIRNDSAYNLNSMALSATTGNFNNVGRFIYDLEHTPYAIRINNWSANMAAATSQSPNQRAGHPADAEGMIIKMRIDISAVSFKL